MAISPENIYLLFGGASEERLVSVASAQNVASQLDKCFFWFLSSEGKVFGVTRAELLTHENPFTQEFRPQAKALFSSMKEALPKIKSTSPVFFLCLHGGEGENGSLQKVFESEKVAFSASDSRSSHLAFEKNLAKEVAAKAKVKIVDGLSFQVGNENEIREKITTFFQSHGPLILKPLDGGSSIGLFKVEKEADISNAAQALGKMANRIYLAEPFIVGRELTVGVVDMKSGCHALPASEIKMEKDRQFDYEGKYLGKGSLEITPAEITAEEMRASQEVAVKMHQALGCSGYSRTDIILTAEGPVYLETNTLPGLSKASFIPQQLAAAKIPFKDFILSQIEIARQRNS